MYFSVVMLCKQLIGGGGNPAVWGSVLAFKMMSSVSSPLHKVAKAPCHAVIRTHILWRDKSMAGLMQRVVLN